LVLKKARGKTVAIRVLKLIKAFAIEASCLQ
jgi:hypothetical protein